jgi:hypothetical protein
MEKLIEKFSNPNLMLKIIILAIGGLALHIKFVSSFMGTKGLN